MSGSRCRKNANFSGEFAATFTVFAALATRPPPPDVFLLTVTLKLAGTVDASSTFAAVAVAVTAAFEMH